MSRFVLPRESTFDLNGLPQDGAFLEFFNVGLLTNKDTFFDENLAPGKENSNPVEANGSGLFDEIWLDGDYDVTLRNKKNALVWGPETIRDLAELSTINFISSELTTATMAANTQKKYADTDVVSTAEFVTGGGSAGGGVYDVVLTSTVTPNGRNIIQGTADTTISFVLRVTNTFNPKQVGAFGDGIVDDSAAITAASNTVTSFEFANGAYKISANTSLTGVFFFNPGARISVDSGITFTLSGDIIAGNTQEIFGGSGTITLNLAYVSIHWFNTVTQAVGSVTAGSTIKIFEAISFAGLNLTKRLNFVGTGREYVEITGSFTLTDTGGNSTFDNAVLKTPSVGTVMITINGIGGTNFRDCQLAPDTGNTMFEWDHTAGAGGTPQIMELMQTKFISGKFLESKGAGVTYSIHVKESSLFSFTQANTLTPFAGGFISLSIFGGLVNINDPQISSASNAQLKFLKGCQIDDSTTNVAWIDNNGTGFDLLDISDGTTMTFDSLTRNIRVDPIFSGSGVGSAQTNFQTVPSGILLTFDPDLFDTVYYEGTATPLVAVQSWVFKAGAGQFKGQSFTLKIIGSIDTQGNNVVMFGRTFTPASQEMQGLTVWGTFDGTNWITSYSDLI